MYLPQPMLQTIKTLERQLLQAQGSRWLIGGSCGLLLYNVDVQRSPRDLDLYVDQNDVALVHASLQEYSLDTPAYSETPIYASILSHYDIAGNFVEVVGNFRVSALNSVYRVEAAYLWEHYSMTVSKDFLHALKVMPLAHELVFNLLRDRPDRYEAIAKAMRSQPELHMPALEVLLQRNSWGNEFRRKLELLFI